MKTKCLPLAAMLAGLFVTAGVLPAKAGAAQMPASTAMDQQRGVTKAFFFGHWWGHDHGQYRRHTYKRYRGYRSRGYRSRRMMRSPYYTYRMRDGVRLKRERGIR
jgi:hypothetical protein